MGTAPSMHIEENLALAARRGQKRGLRWGISKEERETYRTLLSDLGLGLETRLSSEVSTLSGGQRQALTLMATLKSPVAVGRAHRRADLKPAAKVMGDGSDRHKGEADHADDHPTTCGTPFNTAAAPSCPFHEGRVILDISGEEKKQLTVTDLLAQFAKVSGDEFASDRTALLNTRQSPFFIA